MKEVKAPAGDQAPGNYMMHPETFEVFGPIRGDNSLIDAMSEGYSIIKKIMSFYALELPENKYSFDGHDFTGSLSVTALFNGEDPTRLPDQLFIVIARLHNGAEPTTDPRENENHTFEIEMFQTGSYTAMINYFNEIVTVLMSGIDTAAAFLFEKK